MCGGLSAKGLVWTQISHDSNRPLYEESLAQEEMSQRSDDRELLTRYLLGAASGDECEAVEDRYFVDDGESAELLQVEDELIDDYVRGALTASERGLFEENFLCTAERRHRLEFVRDLAGALAYVEAKQIPAPRREAVTRAPGGAPADAASQQVRGQLALDDKLELFDSLLRWLDPVRDRAAEKYEKIRSRLIVMFTSRGCVNAEDLADHTIDRVTRKLPEIMKAYVGDPAHYFYGVAKIVFLESRRQQASASTVSEALITGTQALDDTKQTHKCLKKCLEQLSDNNRELLLQYFSVEKGEKIDSRKELAQSLGISLNAMRVRAHRVKTSVHKCVTSCLEQAKGVR